MELRLIFAIGFLQMSFLLIGQDTIPEKLLNNYQKDIFNLQVDDEKKEVVNVSTLFDLFLNEAPGSIIIITAKDIEERAYTDLIDVFLDIPGFSISSDVQNGVGVSSRGFWTNEAKILVLLDGIILNELAYGSFIIGNRIPLTCIERIEIMRGAGSSIYGNYAGIGVVNILTKNSKTSEGNTFQSNNAVTGQGLSEARLSFENSTKLLNDFNVSVAGSASTGNRSTDIATLANGNTVNFKDSSLTENAFIKLALQRKDWTYNVMYDYYTFQGTFEPVFSVNRQYANQLTFDRKIKIGRIKVASSFISQLPWNILYGDPTLYAAQNVKTKRVNSAATLSGKLKDKVFYNVAALSYFDRVTPFTKNLTLQNGADYLNVFGFAHHADIYRLTRYVNFFGGYRIDKYYNYKVQFSPHAAITKEFKHWHYKIIAGRSLKLPTLQNINLGFTSDTPLIPESITDYQVELGYKGKKNSVILNAYHTQIEDIITFTYNIETAEEGYLNSGSLTIGGLELVYKQIFWNQLKYRMSFSNYVLLKGDAVDYIIDTTDLSRGTYSNPIFKLTNNLNFKFNQSMSIQVNSIYSPLKSSLEVLNDVTEETILVEYKPLHLLDLIFTYKHRKEIFSINIGVKNILNQVNIYAYPSALGYSPTHGRGREFILNFKFNF